MPTPKALTPSQAQLTLVNRLGRRVDRIRQLATKLGARPYRVCLVWTRWTGRERGEGTEVEVQRIEILPTPLVADLSAVTLSPLSAGTLPMGSIRVTEISPLMTADQLSGRMVPVAHEEHIPEPIDFYWEVFEDGRGDNPAQRQKYRLSAQPWRNAENVEWVCLLERVSEDAHRDGSSRYGEGT